MAAEQTTKDYNNKIDETNKLLTQLSNNTEKQQQQQPVAALNDGDNAEEYYEEINRSTTTGANNSNNTGDYHHTDQLNYHKNIVAGDRNGGVDVVVKRIDNGKQQKKPTQQSLFELVYEMIGEKEQRAKEMGTLILLGIMLLIFIMSVTGFFVMWFTEYYNNTMLENLILANNSDRVKSWINPDPKYDTLLKVHVFNYSNIDQYLAGKAEKIQVEDIGPLVYREHTTKVNVVYNDNYTITFRDHRSYEFLPDQSSHGEYVNVVVPNVPLLAAALVYDGMDFFARTAFNAVADRKPFIKLKAHSFLWGYEDKILSLKSLVSSGSSRFGLLKNRNGTSVDSVQINTAVDDITKYSIITQFNGRPLLNFWSDDQCNRIDGSDPSMFPPHLVAQRETLNVFLQVLCRKVPLEFEKEVTILDNIDALRYRTPLNVFSNPEENPDNKCYCENTVSCMPSGIINATKCYDDAPIYPSFPHFFGGDPLIYENFEGIQPQQDLHQTYADIHPRFGFPINGASRIQINIAVHKNSVVSKQMQRIKHNAILPLIWIEITSGNLSEEVINSLYASTFGLNLIQYSLKYGTLLMCLVSFGLIVAGFYYLARKREEQLTKNEKILNPELKALQQTVHMSSINLAQVQS